MKNPSITAASEEMQLQGVHTVREIRESQGSQMKVRESQGNSGFFIESQRSF